MLLGTLLIVFLSTTVHAQLQAAKCQQPIVQGDCFAYMPSFGYDVKLGKCVDFIYGGCGGNDNRFGTAAECEKACSMESVEVDTCSQPVIRGPCRAYFPSWGFHNGTCVEFVYGGCAGNDNRFETEEGCKQRCADTPVSTVSAPTVPVTTVPPTIDDPCSLPLVTGFCKAYFPSWGWKDGKCTQFVYGGCMGNANRFSTEDACQQKCGTATSSESAPGQPRFCSMPLVTGFCRAYIPSYGWKDGKCQRFIYGGCQGNENRFSTVKECEMACGL